MLGIKVDSIEFYENELAFLDTEIDKLQRQTHPKTTTGKYRHRPDSTVTKSMMIDFVLSSRFYNVRLSGKCYDLRTSEYHVAISRSPS